MTLYKKGPKSLASQKAKIFDTFIFFNELDLLTLRLNILDDAVDKFVLVESTKTFQGKNKPLFFKENKKKYSKFLKKIIHIIVDDMPSRATAWEREYFQRNAILRGLGQCSNSDLIIISDLDEIPNLKSLPAKLEDNFFYIFELSLNYYYLNNRCIQMPNWYGSILTKYKNIKGSIQEIRDLLFKVQNEISSGKNIEFVKNAGWHFSYLASPENIAIKIQSFSHAEFNNEKYTNLMTIQNHIKNNEDIFNRGLDFDVTPISQMPSYVKKNIKKYIKMGFINQNAKNLDLDENVNLSLKNYFSNNQGKVSDKSSFYMGYQKLVKAINFKPLSLESPYAWAGHIPFAAWLISEFNPNIFVELGTHSGNSYFAFCQSVRSNQLKTKCYAIDTWEGDRHAGNYSEDIYLKVKKNNNLHYGDFSRLLRMTFDVALSQFKDHSIDLLHIDGLHTYEAVKHDFESWLPKLSRNAVVLFHDTNVRERDFGVWQYWDELKKSYSFNLEFLHSHGLGVLIINNKISEDIPEWLLDSHLKSDLLTHFESLGNSLTNQLELTKYQSELTKYQSELTKLNSIIKSMEESKSWKITAPLRQVMHSFRSFVNNVKK